MEEKRALQALTFERPLPGDDSGYGRGRGENRRGGEVGVRGESEFFPLSPEGNDVKENPDDEQCDRKMDQHHVLSVPRQQHAPPVKGAHHFPRPTSPRPCRSSSGESSK